MATTIETYIDCLGIDLEDLYEMSAAERETFYKNAIRDLSDEELEELEQQFKDAMDYLADELYVYQSELEKIISSGDSSTEEIARAERALDDIDVLFEFTEEESTNFGSAQTEVAEENYDATNGEAYTFSPTDPDNGQEYVIDATATETDDDTGLGEEYDEHYGEEGYVDHDGNSGTALINADEDGDGYADVDTNSDGQITELDMLDADEQPSDQYISLDVDGTIELASYDATTGDTRWKVTTENEDGETITYYITVKGFANIRFTGDYTMGGTDIDTSWDPELLNRCYDGATNTESFGDVMGVAYANPNVPEDPGYYTVYNMANETDNELDLNLDDAQAYAEGREYVITMDDDYTTQETLNLTFPDDAELSFEQEADGDIIITATLEDGSEITVRIENYAGYYDSTTGTFLFDTINITGGTISEDECNDIKSIDIPYIGSDGEEYSAEMLPMVNMYGCMTFNDESLSDYAYREYEIETSRS